MYKKRMIAVVIPAYNEGRLIENTISSIPSFMDKIIVIDDKSTDNTFELILSLRNQLKRNGKNNSGKLIIIKHEKNRGVGGAIITGYKEALKLNMDVAVVMAGDCQMDPKDLPALLDPIVEGKVDYVKGNRLITKDVKKVMPGIRYYGNSILTILTKISSGYWHVMDPQCGYTAISTKVISLLPLNEIYRRYGFPNDLLTKLNVYNVKVSDVPVRAIYGQEKSGIKLYSYIPKVSFLLIKNFFWRMREKYIVRDFHPLVLFYLMGILLVPLGFLLGIYLVYVKYFSEIILTSPTVILCALFMLIGLLSLFFGMLFDMEYNRN